MRKKDKDAFLRSITGTKPIQKKDNIKKSILKNENLNTENIKTKRIIIKNLVEKNSGNFLVRGGSQTEYETYGYQHYIILVEF